LGHCLAFDPCLDWALALGLGLGPWPLGGMANGDVYGCSQGPAKITQATLAGRFKKDILMWSPSVTQ
ncbi:MAG: hypothetical protein ACKPKO_15815, partial [Candidatus Fonsibacter sp.]